MNNTEPYDIYFQREFESHDNTGNIARARLIVYKPQAKEVNRWQCDVQIIGIGHEQIRTVSGLDKLDSVIHGLRMAHTLLLYFAKQENKKLTWLGMDDLGLIPPPNDTEI